jgi:hypothetical protein
VDLAEYIACKRWVAVLEYIDMLPTASRYAEALTNDPERAAELAALPAPSEKWTPPVSEYGVTQILLREMTNQLRGMSQQLVGLAHGKPQQPQLFPGPRTEIDRAVEAMERQHVEDIAGLLGFSPEDLW